MNGLMDRHELKKLLSRLQEMVERRVPEPVKALEGERLAITPWDDATRALDRACLQAVAFANHRGGTHILGISPEGVIEGCPGLDGDRLRKDILNRTRPGIVTDVWSYPTERGVIAIVSTPEGQVSHATSEGVRVRRIGRDNVPQLPVTNGQYTPSFKGVEPLTNEDADFSNRSLSGARISDLDPIQIHYLREILRRKNDQSPLLELSDEDLLARLGLLDRAGHPRVAALLLLGRRELFEERLPQAEVVYIHLNEQEEIDVRKQFLRPMLHTLSLLQDLIEARNRFTVLRQGLFQFEVKDYDEEVYREALVNALVHRDYSRRDASVHVVHSHDHLEISNPGGLIGGVRIDNILYHPPRHRNRRLTLVLQELGLMERAGMGVNRLYRFLLRKGKEPPFYEASDENVRLTLAGGGIDQNFASFIYEEESRGFLFGLDALIILSVLRRDRTIDRRTAARVCQRGERIIGRTLNKMVDQGYLERINDGRRAVWRLTSRLYSLLGSSVSYYRDRGLSTRRQQALILETLADVGSLTASQCCELCGIGERDGAKLLRRMVSEGRILVDGGAYRLVDAPHSGGSPQEPSET